MYAITFKQKVNKYGRLYRPSTRDLAVVKVTVSTVTFSEFVEPGWFGWTGVAYSGMTEVECSDGKTKTFSYLPGIEVSQYTIFASEDAAKAALEKAVAGGGLYTRAGFPLMPSWQIGEVRAALEKAEQSTEEEPSIVRNIPYVSVWDGGNCIAATKADVCLDTKQVFNIQTIDVGDSANVLDHEYIVLHGTEHTVFPKGEAKDGAYWRD